MAVAVRKDEEYPPDLRFWLNRWFEEGRGPVSEARNRADRTRVDRYIIPHLGRRSVGRLHRDHIEQWIETLQEEGIGDPTIHACLLVLRQTLQYAADLGMLKENPAKGVQVSGLQAIRQPARAEILTEEQLRRLLKSIDPMFAPMVLFAARTGAKWEEIIGLRTQDLYLDSGMVSIGRTRAAETLGHIEYTEGKPGEVRLMELAPDLRAALVQYLADTADWRTDDWSFVFLTKRDHKHPLRPNFNVFIWRPAVEKARLPEDLTFYSLRHTAAVHMIEQGWEWEKISRALGHRSVTTTKRTYSKFAQEIESQKNKK